MKWKNELYHHGVEPPAQMWERITHDLDEEFLHFKNELFHAEIAPPDNSWENIQVALGHTAVPTSPSRVRALRMGLRIAAAATIIGIFLYIANYHFLDNDVPVVTGQKNTENNKAIPPPPTVTDNEQEPQKVVTPEVKPLIASNYVQHKNTKTTHQAISVPDRYGAHASIPVPSVSSIPDDNTAFSDRYTLDHSDSRQIRNLKGEIREDVSLMDLPNSYFLMTGPNGQSVRVSSKFRNTIQYLNGSRNEELLDVILRESQYWRNQFSAWREEVGHSAYIPSAENFLDITALMKLLQQHNNK